MRNKLCHLCRTRYHNSDRKHWGSPGHRTARERYEAATRAYLDGVATEEQRSMLGIEPQANFFDAFHKAEFGEEK